MNQVLLGEVVQVYLILQPSLPLPIDLSNMYDDAELTFWMHARGSSMGSLAVGLSNSPNGPFNNVYYQFGEIHANANDPWSQIGINVGSYVGQTLYVSFTYARLPNANPSYTGDLAIDLIRSKFLFNMSFTEFA